jgi:hypothetical protein
MLSKSIDYVFASPVVSGIKWRKGVEKEYTRDSGGVAASRPVLVNLPVGHSAERERLGALCACTRRRKRYKGSTSLSTIVANEPGAMNR